MQATVTMGAAMQAAVTMVVAMGEAEMGEAATREAEMAGVAMEAEVEATVMMAVEMGEASVSSNSPLGGRSPSSRTALPRRAYRPCPNPPFPLGLDTPDSVQHSVQHSVTLSKVPRHWKLCVGGPCACASVLSDEINPSVVLNT